MAGQAVTYCDAIKFGSRVAAQLACPKEHTTTLTRLIRREGCRAVVKRVIAGRAAIWIYRDEAVKRLIDRLDTGQPTALDIWSMGKLFGYADRNVVEYIKRTT